MALVFQYGSNVDSERLNSENRLRGDATVIDVVRTVDDYEFNFTIWSKSNNCAAADIIPGSGRKIWGVLYDIPDFLIKKETDGERKSLDEIEGEGSNYKRMSIRVQYRDGTSVDNDVITYIGINDARKFNIRTSFSYARHIITGLRVHSVPDDYIEYVKSRIRDNNPDLAQQIESI